VLPDLATQTGIILKHKGKAMDLLKLVWRVVFLVTAGLYLAPMVYMQYVYSPPISYSPDGVNFYSALNMFSLLTTPLLIYIPVEVFFHLHKVSTSE
jgi:hypothetical protein